MLTLFETCVDTFWAILILGSGFSNLVVTFFLLGICEYRLLHWKLEFWGYNLGSIIFSFGLVKIEIIPSEVDAEFQKLYFESASLFLS